MELRFLASGVLEARSTAKSLYGYLRLNETIWPHLVSRITEAYSKLDILLNRARVGYNSDIQTANDELLTELYNELLAELRKVVSELCDIADDVLQLTPAGQCFEDLVKAANDTKEAFGDFFNERRYEGSSAKGGPGITTVLPTDDES